MNAMERLNTFHPRTHEHLLPRRSEKMHNLSAGAQLCNGKEPSTENKQSAGSNKEPSSNKYLMATAGIIGLLYLGNKVLY